MTPLHMNILLHYYVSPAKWHESTETHSQFRSDLVAWGLIKASLEAYEATERGQALVEAWLNMPLPVCKWTIPHEGI